MPKAECIEYCDREKEIVEVETEIREIADVYARDGLEATLAVGMEQIAHFGILYGELQQHAKNCPECQREI